MIVAGIVCIEEAEAEGGASGDIEAGNRRGQGRAIGGGVAIEGSGRGGGGGAGEIKGSDVDPGAGGERGGIEAVLELEFVGSGIAAVAPLLAGVGDGEGSDGGAGVIGESRAEEDVGCSVTGEGTEGAVCGAGGAIGVNGASVIGACAGAVRVRRVVEELAKDQP